MKIPRYITWTWASALFLTSAAGGQSSRFEITTEASFDAAAVAAYEGDHQAIYRYIDEHVEAHLGQLQRWLRQPSVSAQNEGIQEMAEMLRDDLKALGFEEAVARQQ